jgi:hypothetical protein
VKKKKAAVITGDIVGSTRLNAAERRKLQRRLQTFTSAAAKQYPDFSWEQYRGDSLQISLTASRAMALRIALRLQSYLQAGGFSIRQAIGLGDMSVKGKQVGSSDGTAFRLSGPLADELKKREELIAITATQPEFAAEWQVHGTTLHFLLQRLSMAQADALYLQLAGLTQEAIARKLHISQPSVYQRLHAAGWNVFHSVLERFEQTVPHL